MDEDTRNSLRAVTLLYTLDEQDQTKGPEVLAAAQADYGRLIAALYDMGYYAPVIRILLDGQDAATIAPISPPARVQQAKVEVTPGPRFLFGRARIAPLAPGTELPEGFAEGQPAEASILRQTTDAAIDGWRAASHARAEVASQQITARHSAARLDADIGIDPGPALKFGPLVIKGESAVREERIRQIAGVRTGKPFDPVQLDAVTERLRRTGTFKSVSVTESAETVNGDQMPIEVQLVDMAPRRFGFGAEISSNEGLALTSFWLHRNLLGGAERLRIDGEIGGIGGDSGGMDARLSFRFDRPGTLNPRSDFYAEAVIEHIDDPHLEQDSLVLETGLTYRPDKRRTFEGGIGLQTARTTDAFGTRDYTLFTLPFTATYDARNSTLNATDGWFGKAELTPFAGVVGVDSGARLYMDLRGYRSLGDKAVLALRGQLGGVFGPDIDDSPAEMLFYSGGSNTVRGHPYQSLGVALPTGDVVGGLSYLGLQSELRVKTGERLSVVGFYDIGFVGEDALPDGSNGKWHSGAGLGVRYDTGIGPIRLDVAAPVTGNGDGVQVYIGIGQAF
ncbi:MAG: BamA/TamA family outer membrane protein [Roseivivax sp.]|nr:BamA/TamA family outer membrane protein [Roseivivax sp.]